MANFNFLSGSSVDNVTKLLYDSLSSSGCYLGMARGEVSDITNVPNVQWGINALIYVEFPAVTDLSTVVASGAGDGAANVNKYYDISSLRSLGGSGNQTVRFYKEPISGSVFSNEVILPKTCKCNYLGKNWMLIEGLPRDYYNYLSFSATATHYISNWNGTYSTRAKILPKSFTNVPFYAQECTLYSKALSANLATGLQKISNVIGESYIVGLHDPSSINYPDSVLLINPSVNSAANKVSLMADTFQIRDLSGGILIDNMKFMDPDNSAKQIYFDVPSPEGDLGNISRHLAFSYSYTLGENQTIKVVVGNRQINELGIWNEAQPYDSVLPVCDANPPGLEVSFLKNPLLVNSIFDVKGMVRIDPSDVWYVKEMATTSDVALYTTTPSSAGGYGFTGEEIVLNGESIVHTGVVSSPVSAGSFIIPLQPYHTFVTGDTIRFKQAVGSYGVTAVAYSEASSGSYIQLNSPVTQALGTATEVYSDPTTVVARITIAKTTDKTKALRYGFTSAMVVKSIDLSGALSPTLDIYRQLFISYRSKDASGNLMTNAVYQAPTYAGDPLFNKTTREWDLGTLLYISNKIPIYRKYAKSGTGKEEFKIIL